MVNFFNLQDVNDRHCYIDVDWSIYIVLPVITEGWDLLVVVVLWKRKLKYCQNFCDTFIKSSLQLSSSDSSKQFEVWSHLVRTIAEVNVDQT